LTLFFESRQPRGRGAVFKPRRGPPALRSRAVSQHFGGYCEGETPLPIPNRAVKPLSADGTWDSRPWESRSPPFLPQSRPAGRLFLCPRGDSLRAAGGSTPRTSRRERLPCGRITAPLATRLIREAARLLGPRLESVLAQGGEVDRQVDRAQHPLGKACVSLLSQSHGRDATDGLGQNICSATELAAGHKDPANQPLLPKL
jgi:hypothetical protein